MGQYLSVYFQADDRLVRLVGCRRHLENSLRFGIAGPAWAGRETGGVYHALLPVPVQMVTRLLPTHGTITSVRDGDLMRLHRSQMPAKFGHFASNRLRIDCSETMTRGVAPCWRRPPNRW